MGNNEVGLRSAGGFLRLLTWIVFLGFMVASDLYCIACTMVICTATGAYGPYIAGILSLALALFHLYFLDHCLTGAKHYRILSYGFMAFSFMFFCIIFVVAGIYGLLTVGL